MNRSLVATLGGALLFTARMGLAETAICHMPPGTEAKGITVDNDTVFGHLAHGDCRGGCPCISTCSPKPLLRVHGTDTDLVLGNSRLARIEKGRVACLHIEDASKADCVFTRKSGTFVETADGYFALAGQSISLDGRPGGEYVVAARVGEDDTVPCVEPTARDSAGTAAGTELAGACTRETMLSAANFHSMSLANYATREVCTSSNPHPDGAPFTRMNGESYCYAGAGAALNDMNGAERDETGTYLTDGMHCHVVYNGQYEVPGAKRPATSSWPMRVNINSPILWRPVATSLAIAN
jgi:hypothetical protein